MSIAEGVRLKDRYRLTRLLGRGGMASVWLAEDEVLERPVAVKVLSDTIASDPEFLARFRREARVAASLSHPNLIGVYDYAEGAERPYLVMEYVPGENLGERLSHDAGVDCGRLARELLGALAHIHAAGIVHRDVKPQNVLVAPDGSAKLIDFGIALPEDATALTSTGNLLGTARYIAPEVMGGAPATQRSDLYSCGVVLRDCIGDEAGTLRALVESLSSSDPGSRPASATEAIARLKRATHVPNRPTERMTITDSPGRAPGRAPARTPALAAILAGLVAVAVAFLVLTGGSGEEPGRNFEARVAESGPQGGQSGSSDRQATEARRTAEPEATASVPAAAGSDPGLGSALNEEGFGLIQAGSYAEAVPVLEEAVRAFPPGTEDVNYAYALFNLGNALRLSGRPEEAIPVLEQRLEIPDQTETVQRELAQAKEEAD